MRALVVGAGAVGGYFGGRLLQAGKDVTFLVRAARRQKLAAHGLVIKSPLGDATLSAPTALSDEIKKHWDLVLLSCKAYDLGSAIDSFAPAVGPNTIILPLLNGMAHLDRLDARFGSERVFGGLCAIAATLDPSGAIIHLNDLHTLVFGERGRGLTARGEKVSELFAGATMTARQSPDIILEMWEKWVFLSSLAAATCLMRAGVGDIISSGGEAFMRALLAETGGIAEKNGYKPREEVHARFIGQLTAADSFMTASMLRDLENGSDVEADQIIGDLLARAGDPGRTPLLSLVLLHLKSYQARARRNGLPQQGKT